MLGISDIGFYLPEQFYSIETLLKERFERGIIPLGKRKALQALAQKIQQRGFRFPASSQDIVTLALNALYSLWKRSENPLIFQEEIFCVVGATESAFDLSKPYSSFVWEEFFSKMISRNEEKKWMPLLSYEIKNACIGGVLALINVVSLLETFQGHRGIVLASDIARYEPGGAAELTQGAGAVALLIEHNPALLSFSFSSDQSLGKSFQGVDDFFRPIFSSYPQVNGAISIEAYLQSLLDSFFQYARSVKKTGTQILEEYDVLVFHTPYGELPGIFFQKLFEQLGKQRSEIISFMEQKCVQAALEQLSVVGNTYSASIFFFLGFALEALLKKAQEKGDQEGKSLEGKKVLFFAYGSGSLASVFAGTLEKNAGKVISAWKLGQEKSFYSADFESYEEFSRSFSSLNTLSSFSEHSFKTPFFKERFYRRGRREDGYPLYDFYS